MSISTRSYSSDENDVASSIRDRMEELRGDRRSSASGHRVAFCDPPSYEIVEECAIEDDEDDEELEVAACEHLERRRPCHSCRRKGSPPKPKGGAVKILVDKGSHPRAAVDRDNPKHQGEQK